MPRPQFQFCRFQMLAVVALLACQAEPDANPTAEPDLIGPTADADLGSPSADGAFDQTFEPDVGAEPDGSSPDARAGDAALADGPLADGPLADGPPPDGPLPDADLEPPSGSGTTCAEAINFNLDAHAEAPDRFVYEGTTVGAGSDLQASCGDGGGDASDVVFRFRAAETGTYTFTTSIEAGVFETYDTLLSVRGLCDDPSSELACDDDDSGSQSRVTLPLRARDEVFVIVDGYSDREGPFRLTIAQSPEVGLGEVCGEGFIPTACGQNAACADDDGDDAFACIGAHAPTLNVNQVYQSPNERGLGVHVAGSDRDEDVEFIVLEVFNAEGEAVSLSGDAPHERLRFSTLSQLDGRFNGTFSGVFRPGPLSRARLYVEDARGLRSEAVEVDVMTTPLVAQGEACDPLHGQSVCPPGVLCDSPLQDVPGVCARPLSGCPDFFGARNLDLGGGRSVTLAGALGDGEDLTAGSCTALGDDDAYTFTAPEAGTYAFYTRTPDFEDLYVFARTHCDVADLSAELACDRGRVGITFTLLAGETLALFVSPSFNPPIGYFEGPYDAHLDRAYAPVLDSARVTLNPVTRAYGVVLEGRDVDANTSGYLITLLDEAGQVVLPEQEDYPGRVPHDGARFLVTNIEDLDLEGALDGISHAIVSALDDHDLASNTLLVEVFPPDILEPLSQCEEREALGQCPLDTLCFEENCAPLIHLAAGAACDQSSPLDVCPDDEFCVVTRCRSVPIECDGTPLAPPIDLNLALVDQPNGGLVYVGETSGASRTSGTCGGANAPEFVGRYLPSVDGSHIFFTSPAPVDGLAGLDTVLYVRDRCSLPADERFELACSDDQAGSPEARPFSHLSVDLVAGVPVFVVVDGFGADDQGPVLLGLITP